MRTKILIVDDVEINRDLLAKILGDEYEVEMSENGKQALEFLDKWNEDIAVILLDLVMPEMDGFQVLEELSNRPWSKHIPIMIISGDNTTQTESRCLEMGAVDFVHRPFENKLVRKRVNNAVTLFQYQAELEEKVKQQTRELRQQYDLLQEQAEQLRQSRTNIIDILGSVVEYRNLESGEHIKRVKGYTRILAESVMENYPEYALTKEKIEVIVSASALHDIGKIAVPDAILLKPGKLTREEFEDMKTHTTKGCDILDHIHNVWDEEYGRACHEICRYQHERYGGRGYPDGLKGDEIPVSAQIVSVADVYDALVHERVYKKAFPKGKAFQMIVTGECGTFSPKIMDCFQRARQDFEKLAGESKD